MVSWVFSIDSIRSLRCVSRKPWRSAVSLYSSRAIMFTGPICSMRWRSARQVSSSAASSSPARRSICRSARSAAASSVHLGQAAGLQVLQIGAQLGYFAGAAGAVLAQLVQRGAPALELRLQGCQLLAQGLRLRRQGSAPGPAPRRATRPVPARAGPVRRSRGCAASRSASAAARCCSMACTRRSRSAWSRSMRWKAASAPRRRSSRPASSAVTCAASCCKPSRFWRIATSCACNSSRAASACACSASRRAALLALLADGAPS